MKGLPSEFTASSKILLFVESTNLRASAETKDGSCEFAVLVTVMRMFRE